MEEMLSDLARVYKRIAEFADNDKAIAQKLYECEAEPFTNSVGFVGEIHSIKSKKDSWMSIDKADYFRIKERTLDSLEVFEKGLAKATAEWFDLPSYLMLRISWQGTYAVKYVIEPILLFSEIKDELKEAKEEEDKASPKEEKKGPYDSVRQMRLPVGTGVSGSAPEVTKTKDAN